MESFMKIWGESARTTLGLFWMAFWAFGFGYLISSMVQVFVTEHAMKKRMGKAGPKSILMATVFGFISSSCSFAALATTRSLFTKGAGLIPALAFLLASTNLVIELGIIIAVFLSWQFVVGEYLGGVMLILLMWPLVKLTLPKGLEKSAREHAKEEFKEDENVPDTTFKERIFSKKGWQDVAKRYVMEWKMVWKDVTIGFTTAGLISAAVPKSFFQALFWGAGSDALSFPQILLQTLAGPLAAFFTFIGSMGNIPLASVLYQNGVSFSAIMAFIFSDLVVLPVLRIQARYYGWKMALYILAIFLTVLTLAALILHYGFLYFDLLPDLGTSQSQTDKTFFQLDTTFVLNVLFLVVTLGFFTWSAKTRDQSLLKLPEKGGEWLLLTLATVALAWLVGGMVIA